MYEDQCESGGVSWGCGEELLRGGGGGKVLFGTVVVLDGAIGVASMHCRRGEAREG